jgi:hypothetical protein
VGARAQLFAGPAENPDVSAIHRWNREVRLDRAGEPLGSLSSASVRQAERASIERLQRLPSRFEDGFDTDERQLRARRESAGNQRPSPQGTVDRLLTNADFQQRLQETLEGTSPRAIKAKAVESTYQSFFKDSQDFAVRKGPSLTVPEPPRYESPAEAAWKGRALTQPEFQASLDDVPESARVQEPAQAAALKAEARRAVAVTPPAFTLLGHAALRG